MCSHWQANSVASRRTLGSRSMRLDLRHERAGLMQLAGRGGLTEFFIGLSTTRGNS